MDDLEALKALQAAVDAGFRDWKEALKARNEYIREMASSGNIDVTSIAQQIDVHRTHLHKIIKRQD